MGKKQNEKLQQRLSAIVGAPKNGGSPTPSPSPPGQTGEQQATPGASAPRGQFSTRSAGRSSERQPAYKFGLVKVPNGNDIKCVIRDTNETGVRVVLEGALVLPPEVMIMVSNFGRAKRARVVWQKELEAGLQFI